MRILFCLIFITLLVLPFGAAKSNPLPPPIIPDCLGVNIHFTGQPTQDLNGLVSGGFGWIRMDMLWASIEKTKGVYDFSAYDSLVAGLNARHIRPLFILDYGNGLYEKGAPTTPDAVAAYARFAAAAAVHFKGKGVLWEIWNEPNGGFWQPHPDPQQYGPLAIAAADAIHHANPSATVLAPGMSGIDLPFMESLCQQGLLKHIDAVSFHPYRTAAPETVGRGYRALRLLLHQYSPDKTIPLVCSEWGYTSTDVSELKQAQYLTREWLYNLSQDIDLSIWYDWHDDGTNPHSRENNFGTVHADYSPKPAFLAAQTLIHTLDGCRFIKRIPLASTNDYLLLFSQGTQVIKLAAWTSGPPHDILLPITRVTAITDMTGAAIPPLLTQGRLTLSLSQSPAYITVGQDNALQEAASWSAAARDPLYSQSQRLRLAVTYHNAGFVTHRVRFESLLTSPNGQKVMLRGGSDLVPPGQTLTTGEATSAFAHVAVRARVGLILDGVLQVYPQDIPFAPTDPVLLSEWPLNAKHSEIVISSSSDEPFQGSLSSLPATVRFPVSIPAAQALFTEVLPLAPGSAVQLNDQQGTPIAFLPPRRYVPYAYLPGTVPLVQDGNRSVLSTAQLEAIGDAQQMTYHFAPGWSFWRISEVSPPVLQGKPLNYGIWVKGDDSGNHINIRYQDATGQVFQDQPVPLNWQGWQFLVFSLRPQSNTSHWGGANDGQPHYPLKLNTLLLLDSVSSARSHAGTIAWKKPTLIYR